VCAKCTREREREAEEERRGEFAEGREDVDINLE